MPKETFFNLTEEKRALICQAAVGEFAAHSFAQASINRIVARSGIAKGSFYQYFEDKGDLFLYLIQLITDEKLKYLASVVQNPERYDFFALLRELSRAGIQFAVLHPQYAEISKRFLASKGTPIYKRVTGQAMPTGLEFFEALLEQAIAKGQVRANIDTEMQAYIITSMYTLVIEYYLERVGPPYNETMMETIEQFLDFLRYGIAAKDSAEPSK
ncbi:MAG: TetR/AcrR family transcriptional regulator [Anaerolineae bacterium]|nr:TetR/AcrR family transcriptional regulator [Anaerolineae bacterium]